MSEFADAILKQFEGIDDEDLSKLEKNIKQFAKNHNRYPDAVVLLDVREVGTIDEYKKAQSEQGIFAENELNTDCEDCREPATRAIELLGDGLGEGLVYVYCEEHFRRRVWLA